LNLASCHEHQGKLATAWFEYLDAVTLARRDGRPDRVAFAQGRLAELEPKLSRLTLVVPEAADYPGLELELDGTLIGRAARGVPTPVDPGAHVVEVRAPGRQSVRLDVEIGTAAEQRTLTIPELPATAPAPAPVPAPVPAPETAEPARAHRAPPPARPIPTSAYVTGAVTAGLLAGAVVTGVLYMDRKEEYERTHAEADYDAARTLAVTNAVLWIGVTGGAGLTTYLYVTRPADVSGVTPASRLPHGAIAHFAGRF
jgi:hypothetical protein